MLQGRRGEREKGGGGREKREEGGERKKVRYFSCYFFVSISTITSKKRG